jgi:hypothetical protein
MKTSVQRPPSPSQASSAPAKPGASVSPASGEERTVSLAEAEERAARFGHRFLPKQGPWSPEDVRMDRVPDLSGAAPSLAAEMAGLAQGGSVEFGSNPAAPGKEAVAAEAASPSGEKARMADGRVVIAGGGTAGALHESRSIEDLGSSLGRDLPFERYRLRGEGSSVVVEGKLNPWVRVVQGRIDAIRQGDMMERPGPDWSWVTPGANPQVGEAPPSAPPDFSLLPPPQGAPALPLPLAPAPARAPLFPPVPVPGPEPDLMADDAPSPSPVPAFSWSPPAMPSSVASAPSAPAAASSSRRGSAAMPAPSPRERHPRAVKREPEPASAAAPARGFKPRRTPGDVYPAQAELTGSMKSYKRKSMGPRHTRQTIDRESDNPDRTPAASVMAMDQESPRPQGLLALGISRNHNIADSSVARLTTEAHASASTPARQASVASFLTSLSGAGSDVAQQSVEAFQASQQQRAQGQAGPATASLRRAIDQASVGPENVRFDDAAVNEEALHGADFELAQGQITPRAEAMRDATLDLARTGAVSHESAFNAVQPTIRTSTDASGVRRGQYVSSSVSSHRSPRGQRWGDMQDPETFRPRRRSLSERRSSSEPRELPSSSNRTPDADDEMDNA